jgi:hypothetical protein
MVKSKSVSNNQLATKTTINPKAGVIPPQQQELQLVFKQKRIQRRYEDYDLRKILRSYGEDDRGCL